jgi:hypothetical protein
MDPVGPEQPFRARAMVPGRHVPVADCEEDLLGVDLTFGGLGA